MEAAENSGDNSEDLDFFLNPSKTHYMPNPKRLRKRDRKFLEKQEEEEKKERDMEKEQEFEHLH